MQREAFGDATDDGTGFSGHGLAGLEVDAVDGLGTIRRKEIDLTAEEEKWSLEERNGLDSRIPPAVQVAQKVLIVGGAAVDLQEIIVGGVGGDDAVVAGIDREGAVVAGVLADDGEHRSGGRA